MFSEIRKRVKKAGKAPGTALYTGEKKTTPPKLTVLTFSEKDFKETVSTNLDACLPKDDKTTAWLSVEGLHDVDLIKKIAKCYSLHPLTVEDILNVDQRSKIEEFDNYIFITIKMLLWHEKPKNFAIEQLSLVLTKNTVLSFQENESTFFDGIRERIKSGRLRHQDSDYLCYRLIDTVVDQYFVVLEELGNQIEDTEQFIINSPTPQSSRTIYKLKRQMLTLRKAIWPMREVLSHLLQTEEKFISAFTRIYLRDVYDHTMQAIDTLETFRDMLSGMLDMYLSSLTNRMNEIMKVLTIFSTIFIPITFIASLYGMNFQYMPELHWRWGYPITLGLMLSVAIVMLIYFRRKKWI